VSFRLAQAANRAQKPQPPSHNTQCLGYTNAHAVCGRASADATASTISSSEGNPQNLRPITSLPSIETLKVPGEPTLSSGSIPRAFLRAAAARVARGSYPQEWQ